MVTPEKLEPLILQVISFIDTELRVWSHDCPRCECFEGLTGEKIFFILCASLKISLSLKSKGLRPSSGQISVVTDKDGGIALTLYLGDRRSNKA